MSATQSLDPIPRPTGGFLSTPSRKPTPPWLKLIQEAVEASDFGTVQIKVHGGEVVQIETTRKIRVPAASSHSSSYPTAPAEEN